MSEERFWNGVHRHFEWAAIREAQERREKEIEEKLKTLEHKK